METDIKITMLGGSGAGKTCFMLAMHDIMSMGVEGFTFTTLDLDESLDLQEEWDRLCDGTDLDRWPSGTGGSRSYRFRFSYGGHTYLTFEWLDYRGGALAGRSDDPDLGVLRKHLQESFGVFIVVPSDQLIKEDYQAQKGLNLKAINQLLSDRSDDRANDNLLPVVSLVVTKADIWQKEKGEGKKDEMVGKIKRLFNPLFVPGGDWTVSIVPVTLGNHLCDDMAGGVIAPQAIHYPVTFTIHELYKLQVAAAKGELDYLKEVETTIRNRKPTWFEKVFGKSDYNDPEKDDTIDGLKRWHEQCSTACKNISQGLKADIPVFKNGEEVTNGD